MRSDDSLPLNFTVPRESLRPTPIAYRMMACQLGILDADSDWSSIPNDSSPSKLVERLESLSVNSSRHIQSSELSGYLRSLEPGPQPPGLTFDREGTPYVILGRIDQDGVSFYQMICGSSSTILFDETKMKDAGFARVWYITPPSSKKLITLGQSVFEIDNFYFNFGQILPFQDREFTLQIKNHGPGAIRMEKRRMSCGCTTTAIGTTLLQPDQELAIPFTLRPGKTESLRTTIALQVMEENTQAVHYEQIEILACQRPSMEVIPAQIDFGTLTNWTTAEPPTRSVRLTEVATDRFEVLGIETDLPVTYVIERSASRSDPADNTYNVKLQVDTSRLQRKSYRGEIVIRTNSALRPAVHVPISFNFPGATFSVPSSIVLEQKALEKRVQIRTNLDYPVFISTANVDPRIEVTILNGTAKPDRPAELLLRTLGEDIQTEATVKLDVSKTVKGPPIDVIEIPVMLFP